MENITQNAWNIRRNISERSGKPLMQISWGTCYRLAYRMANPQDDVNIHKKSYIAYLKAIKK